MPSIIVKEYIKRYFKERMYLPDSYDKLYIIIKENYSEEPITFNLQYFFDKEIRNYS